MANRRYWNRGFVCLLITLGASSCFDFDWPDSQAPRWLDRVCDVQPCEVEGSARRVTGLTHDSVGFRLGPGPGVVRLPLAARADDFVAEFLVAGRGHVVVRTGESGAIPQRFELTEEFTWVSASGTSLGETDGWGEALEVSVAVEDDESEAELADIRASGMSTVGTCSIGVVGKRRPNILRVLERWL